MMTINLKGLRATARQFTNLILASICILIVSLPAVAQNPPPAQPTTTPPAQPTTTPLNVQDLPVSRPIPQRSIGLDPGKVVSWTQRDAIMAALEKNVDIELERENVRLAQWDLFASHGVYDPVATSRILYQSSINPTTFRASGLEDETGGVVTRKSLAYDYGIKKNLEHFGADYEVLFNNQRLTSNTNTLSTQYSPNLTISFTQPLFKNLKIDTNRRAIKIFKKKLDLSDAVFRQRSIEIISTVQQAYWDLALAIKQEEIARDAVGLAEEQLKNNKRQVEVGTLAPIDVVSAATQVESRRQTVYQAMNQVAQAENALKNLTASGPNDDLWNSRIDPVESFDIKPISIPLADAVKLAQENRPEIKQLALQQDINKVDIDFFRNQAKPQIDLIAGYGINGLGGTPANQTVRTCSSPININDQLTCLSLGIGTQNGQFVPIVNQTPFTVKTVPASVDPDFVGGYGTALKNLWKNEFRTWSVGVQFNFPIRNRAAKANLGKAREEGRQLDLQSRKLLQDIEVEVRNAVQAVEIAKLRIDASRAEREYAEKQLEGEQKRFAAGLQITFFVLQRQNELSAARFQEQRALADYNIAVAQLQRVLSTTLSSNNIEIKSEVPPTK